MTSMWRQESPYHCEYDAGVAKNDDDGNGDCDTNNKNESSSWSLSVPTTVYPASCYCGRVKYEVRGEPESAKFCHCRGCQQLHGAPFEWVCVFYKHNVKFVPTSLDFLYFYSDELDQGWDSAMAHERVLPVKVSCSHCRTPIADEGRHMWLAFATLFGFTIEGNKSSPGDSSSSSTSSSNSIPVGFRCTDHLFYGQRCVNVVDTRSSDTEPTTTTRKWVGHRNKSPPWKPNGELNK